MTQYIFRYNIAEMFRQASFFIQDRVYEWLQQTFLGNEDELLEDELSENELSDEDEYELSEDELFDDEYY